MPPQSATISDSPAEGIKHVPQDAAVRQAIRAAAADAAASIDRQRPCSRDNLESRARSVLERLGLPCSYLGFAMVAVSNEFWRPVFGSIPMNRRLFLLPHCLSNRTACTGKYDSVGLHCAGCGGCEIDGLKRQAEDHGYSVIVAEGTGSVIEKVLDGDVDAVLGVACLDSLEKSFDRVAELGVPHMALPLLIDGCSETKAEVDHIRSLLAINTSAAGQPPRSYVALLRETTRMFQSPLFDELLADFDGSTAVEDAAMGWLKEGGKRLRPFVTLAAYAVARYGTTILDSGEKTGDMLPHPIRRIALAIEALHKASLVHDDIEDEDEFRYGRPTLHRVYGVGQAVNIGDYLIGLGYRLIAGEASFLGAECTTDILTRLSHAHLELCRGQGEELVGKDRSFKLPRPLEVLAAYAMKTSPAFEAAVFAGLRAAGTSIDLPVLRRFSTFLGEAFQIQNDLEDWEENDNKKRHRGLDVLAGRPTILRALVGETSYANALAELTRDQGLSREDLVGRVREIYRHSGAFAKADELLRKLRAKALDAAADFPTAATQDLMQFLLRMVLRDVARHEAPGP